MSALLELAGAVAVAVAVAVVLVGAVVAVVLGARALLERRREPQLVRVHFTSEEESSVEGVLVAVSRDHYRLRRASQYVSADSSIPLAGEVWIERARVLLIQRL